MTRHTHTHTEQPQAEQPQEATPQDEEDTSLGGWLKKLFGFTDDYRAEIALLEEENKKLTAEVESLKGERDSALDQVKKRVETLASRDAAKA